MSTSWKTKYKPDYKVWGCIFAVLFVGTGFIHLYPDHPLWLAWLLSPLIVGQGLLGGEPEVYRHAAVLASHLALVTCTSWVLHSLIVLVRTERQRRQHGCS